MATVLKGAPESCPGPESEHAGRSSSCQGCPNQSICSSGQTRGPDPDIDAIKESLAYVRHKVLILSGKGGVGKSTVTATLARGLAADDNRNVAVMDIDVCGPSIPRVMGLEGEQVHQSGSGWSPVYVEDNLSVMSVGFLLGSLDDAVIWRGPKKNGIIKQFLRDVDWGKVDFMLVDTPPGTSDEHLSIAQLLKPVGVDGVVIVTTPQEVSLLDVRKEIDFCRKVGLPIIGIVENMSSFVCPNCKVRGCLLRSKEVGTTKASFGNSETKKNFFKQISPAQSESVIFPPTTGGASKMSEELNIQFLGKLPLDPRIGKCCDEGKNFLQEHPDSPAAISYNNIIQGIIKHCELRISN